MERGFVYVGKLSEEELHKLLDQLGASLHFSWSLAEIICGEGIPSRLLDFGTAFKERHEVRWQRAGEKFHVLLISEQPREDLGLSPVEGEWGSQEIETKLWDLREMSINPPFTSYPLINEPDGKLKCRVFYRNGLAVFVSPREVLKSEARP